MNSKDGNGNVAIYSLLMSNSFSYAVAADSLRFCSPLLSTICTLQTIHPCLDLQTCNWDRTTSGPSQFIILRSSYRLGGTVEVQLSFARAAYKAPLFQGESKSSDCTADFWRWKFLEDSELPPRSPEIENRNWMEIEVIFRLTGF